MPGVPGDPAAVEVAADALDRAAQDLATVGDAVAAHGRAATATWSGSAAVLAATAVGTAATGSRTTAGAVRAAVGPLRAFAAELRRAQQDWLEGERMALQGQALLVGAGSGAPADAARESGRVAITDGAAIMTSAEDRARTAAQDAARALDAAGAVLAGLSPTAPTAAPPDGDAWDGLVKAGGDVVDEVANTVGGVLDHVDVFDPGFGDTWKGTWETTQAAVTDPLGAVGTMVQGTVAPVVDSYQTGGLDEAVGRSPGVIAAALGGKGLGKLGRLRDLAPDPAPGDHTPLAPGGGLQRHEDAGGHTLDPSRAHVGASDQDLLDRQARSPAPLLEVSSYDDRQTAESAIHDNITANRAAIDEWIASGPTRPQEFDFEHPWPVGRYAPPQATLSDVIDVPVSRLVLKVDPSMPGGYYILTSYPRPVEAP